MDENAKMREALKTKNGIPGRIYLQWNCGEHDSSWGNPDPGAVTWCADRIFADDIEYVRVVTQTNLADFYNFWQSYPRKVGKQAALRKWKSLKPSVELCFTIQKALEAQKQTDQWQKGFIPNPATWLNQARWEDEITAPLSLEDRAKLGEEHWKTVKANR